MGKHDSGEVARVTSCCTSTLQNNCSVLCAIVAHSDTVYTVLCSGVMSLLGVDRALVEHMCRTQTELTVTDFPACSPVAADRPAVGWKSEQCSPLDRECGD